MCAMSENMKAELFVYFEQKGFLYFHLCYRNKVKHSGS